MKTSVYGVCGCNNSALLAAPGIGKLSNDSQYSGPGWQPFCHPGRTVSVVDAESVAVSLNKAEPASNATLVEPNAPVELYFNKAIDPAMATIKFKNGYVMARSIALDDDGQPILVEFDDQGNEIGELPSPSQYGNQARTKSSGQSPACKFTSMSFCIPGPWQSPVQTEIITLPIG
mgnify:CR=1 FL=1